MLDDDDLLAQLLTSIKTEKTNFRRTLTPIEVAGLIDRLVTEEGQEVAESILPIKKDMIKYFIRLLKDLPEECHDAVVWQGTDDLGVVFSAAHYVATLKNDEDKKYLFAAASSMKIKKEEIKEIISFYKKHDFPLKEVVEKVTNARPVVVITYLIVISISEGIKKKLEEISNKTQKDPKEILKDSIREKFQIDEIMGIAMKGKNIAISLHENEYRSFKRQTKKLGLFFDEISAYLVKD